MCIYFLEIYIYFLEMYLEIYIIYIDIFLRKICYLLYSLHLFNFIIRVNIILEGEQKRTSRIIIMSIERR